jgi:hypothetical protein
MTGLERDILQWVASWPLGPAIMTRPWAFPTLETLHFMGVCFLFGSLLLVDLRLLGVLRGGRPGLTFTFLWVTLLSFALLLLTGIAFFSTNPMNYWSNPVFKIKMTLIVFAGLNAAIFTLFEHRQILALGSEGRASAFSRWAAALSLASWTLVLFAGRSLPLFDTGQG